MKKRDDQKWMALLLLITSALFFCMGFMFPLLKTGYGIGPFTIRADYIYISSSFRYFFGHGEAFIGVLLLFFTIIFPVIKYIFLFVTLSGFTLPKRRFLNTALEIINKWAMLDVFVVALLILNMKFDSTIIVSKLQSGTTLFAISVVLMMVSSIITGKFSLQPPEMNK
jgi:paraquat-inducible protein A